VIAPSTSSDIVFFAPDLCSGIDQEPAPRMTPEAGVPKIARENFRWPGFGRRRA